MRFQAKFSVGGGEVKSQLVNGESWVDAVNTLLDRPNVKEIFSVRNLKDVPLNEQISLIEAKPAKALFVSKVTQHHIVLHENEIANHPYTASRGAGHRNGCARR
jgi:hypothetical protein